jgi:hypothetical protein
MTRAAEILGALLFLLGGIAIAYGLVSSLVTPTANDPESVARAVRKAGYGPASGCQKIGENFSEAGVWRCNVPNPSDCFLVIKADAYAASCGNAEPDNGGKPAG